MMPLLDAVRNKDRQKAIEWACSEHWATVEQLITVTSSSTAHLPQVSFDNSSRMPSSSGGGTGVGVGTEPIANPPSDQTLWTCSFCTFLNAADLAMCEMCSLPRYT